MSAFDENGNYNRTNWKTGDKITADKLNKIEDALESINTKVEEVDTEEVKNIIGEVNLQLETMTEKIDDMDGKITQTEVNIETMVAEVEGELEELHTKDDEFSAQLEYIKNGNIYFDDYNPYKNNENDNSDILIQALNDCAREKKDLIVSNGIYRFDKTIEIKLNGHISIKGSSCASFNKIKFYYTGNSNFLVFTNASNVYFENIEISGRDGNNDFCLTEGSIGIQADSSIITKDCYLNGFDTIIKWNGGYYHKFENTRFSYSNKCLDFFDGNNVIVDKCTIQRIGNFITVASGNGGLHISNSSFEVFTKTLFAVSHGANTSISVMNCYFENYPNVEIPNGLNGSANDITVIVGYSNIALIANFISTTGIKRFVNSSCKQLISLGNRIDVQENLVGDMEYFIRAMELETAICNDFSEKSFTHQTGSYNSQYIHAPALKKGLYTIYDCFEEKKYEAKHTTWIELEPINGWTKSSIASHSTLGYRIDGNKVTLKGIIISTNATDDTIVNLPDEIKPTGVYQLPAVGIVNNEPAIIRVSSTRIFSTFRNGAITLDGVSYYLD